MLELIVICVSVSKMLLKRTIRFSAGISLCKENEVIIILGLRSQRENNPKFEACLGYTMRSYLKKTKQNTAR